MSQQLANFVAEVAVWSRQNSEACFVSMIRHVMHETNRKPQRDPIDHDGAGQPLQTSNGPNYLLYGKLAVWIAAFTLQAIAVLPAVAEKRVHATTMANLDALAAAQNWAELHDRLTDISPAARNAHWNSLVEQAAIGELTPQAAPGGSAAERLAAIERYYPKFSSLASSAKFLALRTTVGLEAFARCFRESSDGRECRDALERFVNAARIIGIYRGGGSEAENIMSIRSAMSRGSEKPTRFGCVPSARYHATIQGMW